MQRWFLDKCDGVNLNYVCATCVEEMKISDRNNDVNFVASMCAANSYSCNLQFMMNLVTVYQNIRKTKRLRTVIPKKNCFIRCFCTFFFFFYSMNSVTLK